MVKSGMQSLAKALRTGAAAILLLAACAAGAAFAADVFVATMRAPSGSNEKGGHLYRVDLASGKSKFVGRILVDGTQPAGLSAMAFHPRTNVLYGITMGINDANRAALLTIDPASGVARVVGRLTRPLTDISFDPVGRLFGWTANTGQLAFIDVNTAKVTTVGESASAAKGGAFAIDSRGNAYVAPWSERGRLDRVDLREGTLAPGPRVSHLPDASALRSMAFSSRDELLATHSVRSALGASALLRIDPATGEARAIGEIPEDSEAIAVAAAQPFARAELMRSIAYGVLAAMLCMLGWIYVRGRSAGPAIPR
jgi:hypothetical protein